MPPKKDENQQQTPNETPESAAPDATGDDEFDKAFEEFADSKPADPDATPPDEGRGEDDPDGEADAAGASGAEDPPKTASGAGAPGADDDQDAGAGDGAASTEGDKPDIWADAPDALRSAHEADRKELERLRQENRSHRGRLSYQDRRISELESAQPGAKAPGKDNAAADQEASDLLESDEWKGLKEEYPEVTGPLEGILKRFQTETAQLKQDVSRLSSANQVRETDEEFSIVLETHPDFNELAGTDAFEQWAATQPAYVRDVIVRNGNQIVNGEETVDVMTRFKQSDIYRGLQGQAEPNNAGDGGEPEPSGDPANGADPGTAKLASRRKKQLEASETMRGKGTGAGKGPPDDFDAAFDYFAAR